MPDFWKLKNKFNIDFAICKAVFKADNNASSSFLSEIFDE